MELLWLKPHPGITYEGRVPVVDDDILSISMLHHAQNQGSDCLTENTTIECMRTNGSYGIKRLRSMPFHLIDRYGWTRANWMAHESVQESKLMQVALPMSHASSAFEMYDWDVHSQGKGLSATVIRQDYDIYQQLRLGIRAFDLPIAYNMQIGELYCANRELTVSLSRVLNDMRLFLDRNPKEVIVLDMRIAELVQSQDLAHAGCTVQKYFDGEEEGELPGQMVTDLVTKYLGPFVATSTNGALSIKQMVAKHARVIYFWNGTQVTCAKMGACNFTQLEEEDNKVVVDETPLCIGPSLKGTASNDAWMVMHGVINFTKHTPEFFARHPPSCRAKDTSSEDDKKLNVTKELQMSVVGRLDAHLSYSEEEYQQHELLFRGVTDIYVRGEPLSCRSDAERLNYLLLTTLLAREEQVKFSQMSLVSMDFVNPALVHRILSVSQHRPDCGYLLECLDSGSCFAADLHNETAGCLKKDKEWTKLLDYVEWRPLLGRTGAYIVFVILWIVVKLLLLYTLCCHQPKRKK
jgi:hypothetical protein